MKWYSHLKTIVLSLQPLISHKTVFLKFYNTARDNERMKSFSKQDKAMTSFRRTRLFYLVNKGGYISKEAVELCRLDGITG